MKQILFLFLATASLTACSKLDEKLGSQLQSPPGSSSGGSAAALLDGTYGAMRGPFQDQARLWCTQEHTSDEAIGPTRAGDWDDNGIWRTLHAHDWDQNHSFLGETYTDLGKVVFAATDLLRFNPTPQQAAEARLLRAMANFAWVDGWDKASYRENTNDANEIPKVRTGAVAIDYIISELNAIIPNLPVGPANKANKDAARFLLMRCYLNKAVYANRTNPAFAPTDMTQVITLADQITQSPRAYSLTTNYFTNFAPNNDGVSSENIWTAENVGGSSSGNVRSRWFCTLHYNMNPSGWNGFTTLSDFYSKFDAADARRGGNAYPGVTNVSGIKPGFLVGQQFDQNGVALKDRTGAPLAFTPAVKSVEVNSNLEVTGIRVVKYVPDYVSGDNSNNDYVYARYADVLLMKAEALLRGGSPSAIAPITAVAATNLVRARAGAPALASVSLDNLIDERGREMYWEGTRRTDLIRFGKFLAPWQEKPTQSDAKRLIFPIPGRQLAANPNLTQNPGY
jgi:starch-binding outer membrane protein, SusD/RagB family